MHAVNILTREGRGLPPLAITRLGFGGAPLGGLYTAVSDEAAFEALDAAWRAGIRYFDTAPLYGFGLSEQRLGAFLRTKPRAEFVLSTKVGRLLRPTQGTPATGGSLGAFVGALPNDAIHDFSADAVKRSLDESLTRLGLDRIDLAFIHDPDNYFETAIRETYPTLRELRQAGVVRAIGAGMNQWQMLEQLIERCDLDVVLLAGRYTLLDRSAADSFLPRCTERGVAVIAGGVFNSGILAEPEPRADAMFNYAHASPAVLATARALARACAAFGKTLASAALQFPLRHPAVAGIVIGMRDGAEVADNLAALADDVPSELWVQIDRISEARAEVSAKNRAAPSIAATEPLTQS